MTATVRHRTRWGLLCTGACLVVAFTMHDALGQRFGQPGIPRPPTGGFSGVTGGISGVPGGNFAGVRGGFSGVPGGITGIRGGVAGFNGGNFTGRPNSVIGGVPGTTFTGGMPTAPSFRFVYKCSRCNREVGASASSCPFCGTRFINRPGGLLPPTNPGFNPGQPTIPQPPLRSDATVTIPPNSWKPVDKPAESPAPSTPTSDSTPSKSSDSGSKSSSDDSSGGLSSKVLIGAGVAALGLFALIGGVIVAMSGGGGSASQKLKRRPKSFD